MNHRHIRFGRFVRILIHKDRAYWQESFGLVDGDRTIMMLPGGIGIGNYAKSTTLDEAWDRLARFQARA